MGEGIEVKEVIPLTDEQLYQAEESYYAWLKSQDPAVPWYLLALATSGKTADFGSNVVLPPAEVYACIPRIQMAFQTLEPRLQEVLKLRFGFYGRKATLEETANRLEITVGGKTKVEYRRKRKVRGLEEKAIRSLRARIKKETQSGTDD